MDPIYNNKRRLYRCKFHANHLAYLTRLRKYNVLNIQTYLSSSEVSVKNGAGDRIAIEGDRRDRISVQAQRKAAIKRPLHVLLVDDDEDLLNLLKLKLEKSGRYRIVTTSKKGTIAELIERIESLVA